ncbi:M50 family metallopeptidase [Lentibacillus salinarum]|uniref:M50 family metallopeptidase n=1 Tax=Lentibacillus salinarum TaxID=446820 RepID=A0ABW3ZQS4_9BACI
MTFDLLLYLVFIVAPAGTAVHEIGHVMAAGILGADRMTLSIGTGLTVYRSSWHKTAVSIQLLFFLGGMASSERKVPYRKREQIMIAAFGPLTSLSAAFLCAGLYAIFPTNYLLLLVLFNVWLALVNMIPFRFGGKQSDGYTIYKTMRRK